MNQKDKSIKVSLAGNGTKEYKPGIRIIEAIKDLGPKVAASSLAAKIDGKLVDLFTEVSSDCHVEPVTFEDFEGKNVYWHSTSHVLAHAVKELSPEAKLGIGPPTDEGFYYDFEVEKPFSPEDLKKIEEKMKEIVKRDASFQREVSSKTKAKELFESQGEKYKVELIEELEEQRVPVLYRENGFVDLCKGPHLPSTGYIKAFKLLSTSGAYWRGDEQNPMLQRIYGISFPEESQLGEYLSRLQEAQKRDHRRLGRKLDLFSINPEIGPGLIHWHPKGAAIRKTIEDFWEEEHQKRGYQLVYTPHIAREKIYHISGHMENYSELMYPPMNVDGTPYRLKPMNCPGHIMIFKTAQRSYRDLPIRYAELGTVYRYERSGVLHGMLRVRGFTQDDSHIFCTKEQLQSEITGVLDLVEFMMKNFGYNRYKVYLSTRPEKSIGSDQTWEKATSALKKSFENLKISYQTDPGEGIFYGPKIDIKIEDALGREWQGPTIQLDFNLPERFDINYIGPDSKAHRVVMIHRTVLGTMERFIGGLIEHYAGAFPTWLAPVQVVIIPITNRELNYAREVVEELKLYSIRVEVDQRDEKVGYKIREAETQKVPYMLIVGPKEVQQGNVAVRKHRKGDLGVMALGEFRQKILEEIKQKIP